MARSWPPRCASRCRRPDRAGVSPRSRGVTATSRWWAGWPCSPGRPTARWPGRGWPSSAPEERRSGHRRGAGAGGPRADAGADRRGGPGRRGRPLARRRHPRDRGLPAPGGGHAGRAHVDRGARPMRRGPVNKAAIRVTVNGQEHERTVEVRSTLADFRREDLDLTGTHVGCEQGVGGACTVLLDGEPVRSCLMLAVQADGHRIATIEGVAPADGLHPIQEAFWAKHVLQCGYCTPGIIMSACAFLRDRTAPSREEIRVLRGRATAADRVTLAGGEAVRVLGLSGLSAGDAVELAIRPERIRLARKDRENVMDGRVNGVVYQGVQTDLTVEIGGGQRLLVFVAEPAPAARAPGQVVRLQLPPGAFMRLHGAGGEAGR